MSFEELQQSIQTEKTPPEGLAPAVRALWHDARGDWDAAHEAAQEAGSASERRAGDWVHAYLHRKEGDLGNAGYWYARAGRPVPAATVTLQAEWEAIAKSLLENAR